MEHVSRTPIPASSHFGLEQSQSQSTIQKGGCRPDHHVRSTVFLWYQSLTSIQGSHRGTIPQYLLPFSLICFQLSLFLGSMGIMEGRTIPQIKQKFTDLYPPALVTNWQVWPLAQLFNFRFMPLPYRVPFQSTCGIFWTLYLSVINSKYIFSDRVSHQFTDTSAF